MGAKVMKAATNTINNESNSYAAWVRVCNLLKSEYGEGTFNSWLNHLNFVDVRGSEVILAAPTRFIREWILNNYMGKIKEFWRRENNFINSVNILIRQGQPNKVMNAQNQNIAGGVDVTGQNVGVLEVIEIHDDLGSPLDRRFTFDNFVVGSSNRLAFSAAKSVADNGEIVVGNNPLFLHGGVGLGKTHLMHAIALQIKENQPTRKVMYLSAEKFMYQFVKALRNNEVMAFKDKFRSVDVLMIDDVQFICGKESTQEEFFHTVNALLDMNKQIVISGDRSPSELDGMKERVKSRLGWGMVADIKATDFDLRLGILKSKAENMKSADVPELVLEFLAGKIKSNIRELEGALNKVIAHSSLMGKRINLQTTQEILVDLLRANERTVTIAEIQKKVAEYFNIKISDMSSAKRARCIARPRQIAMYLCKQLTVRSLSEIGRKFGGKDHTTVMHAVKKVIELSETDGEFKKDLQSLINIVNQ
jgi:chromosomal replication initiator protein